MESSGPTQIEPTDTLASRFGFYYKETAKQNIFKRLHNEAAVKRKRREILSSSGLISNSEKSSKQNGSLKSLKPRNKPELRTYHFIPAINQRSREFAKKVLLLKSSRPKN